MCPKLQMLIYFDIKMSEKNRLLSLMVFEIFMFKREFQCAKQWPEWLKGAFFRNIYLRKYLVKEAKI